MHVEQKAKIRQLHYRDHWPVGTIASNLGFHPDTVKKALLLDKRKPPVRVSEVAGYRALIEKLLEDYPKLTATRILDMIREQGYQGTVYPVRRIKRELTKRSAKAYLDLKFLPGEQAQVDWASFGHMSYGGHKRALNLFLMVLSYSRRIYAHFFHDMKSARVLEGHRRAFEYFGGVPRYVLVDNMKTAVITNTRSAIQFNENFLELAAHYCFIPKACNPRAGWEKGKVEKAVRYIRDRFFEARDYSSLADLNNQLDSWLVEISDQRPWAEGSSKTVAKAFEEERLVSYNDSFEAYEQCYVRVDKKAHIRFDTNKYPVPPEHVGKNLELRATHDALSLMSGPSSVASYPRCWDKHQTIHCPSHQESIAGQRGIVNKQRRSVLENTVSCASQLLDSWNKLGESLSQQSKNILELVKDYGVQEVEAACQLALENNTPRSCSIQQILMRKAQPPSVKIKLPQSIANIDIDHRSMGEFDELYKT